DARVVHGADVGRIAGADALAHGARRALEREGFVRLAVAVAVLAVALRFREHHAAVRGGLHVGAVVAVPGRHAGLGVALRDGAGARTRLDAEVRGRGHARVG